MVQHPNRGKQGVILFNNGDNTFTEAEGDVPLSETARYLLVEDFNGDQIPDIYVADHGWDAATVTRQIKGVGGAAHQFHLLGEILAGAAE